jgi:hypothetical protein
MAYGMTLSHGMSIDVIVYDGTFTSGDCEYGHCRQYYSNDGVPDCAENHANPVWRRFTIDAMEPVVEFISEETEAYIEIRICDETSGVDETSVMIGDMTIDEFNYWMEEEDEDTRASFKATSLHCGILTIGPISGAVDWDLEVSDKAGNFTVEEIKRGGSIVGVTDVKFYPNPYMINDMDEPGYIAYELSKDAHVTIKIYDFAGLPVATLVDEHRSASSYREPWYGTDANGETVAPGAYIGFVKIDDGHKVITKNLKIAVGHDKK